MERIIGIEVEYGISSPTEPSANPILTSTQAVLAYAAAAGGSEEDWQAFHDRFLTGDEAAYQAAVAAFQEEQA